jgi:hypothetical protein
MEQVRGDFMDRRNSEAPKRKKISIGSRHFHLPHSRAARIGIGAALIIGGILGFLPMIPLGLFILSQEFGWIRRMRRRLQVWWEKRNRRKQMLP